MSSEKIAKFLAVALGPHIWTPLLFILIISKSGMTPQQTIIIFPTVLLLQVIIPIAYLIIAPKLGWVGKWDMETKEERRPFSILMLALTAITLIIIYLVGNSFLLHLNLIFITLLIALSAITVYWKISLHTSLNTAASIIVNFLFGWSLPFLYLAIPAIFWARLELKKHTVSQLAAGIVVTTIITIGGFVLFGYF